MRGAESSDHSAMREYNAHYECFSRSRCKYSTSQYQRGRLAQLQLDDDSGVKRIQSVSRACHLLETLRDAGRDLPLHVLASSLDVHSSTAYRLLASLQEAGFVARDESTGHYRLGLATVTMSGVALSQIEVLRVADPELRRLARDTNETVNFGIKFGHELLNVEQIASPDRFRSYGWQGQRAPLHMGCAARALIAHRPVGEIQSYSDHVLSEQPTFDVDRFAEDLEEIRFRGYAVNRGEINPNVYAVGAPILGRNEYSCAAVSIVGFQDRFTDDRISKLIPTLLRSTETISHQLGYAGVGIPRFA